MKIIYILDSSIFKLINIASSCPLSNTHITNPELSERRVHARREDIAKKHTQVFFIVFKIFIIDGSTRINDN